MSSGGASTALSRAAAMRIARIMPPPVAPHRRVVCMRHAEEKEMPSEAASDKGGDRGAYRTGAALGKRDSAREAVRNSDMRNY
jgi:hypothetical protein